MPELRVSNPDLDMYWLLFCVVENRWGWQTRVKCSRNKMSSQLYIWKNIIDPHFAPSSLRSTQTRLFIVNWFHLAVVMCAMCTRVLGTA